MSTLRQWIQFLKQGVWHVDLRTRSGLQLLGLSVLRIVLHVATRFSRSLASLQAAGLTLMTLLALVPMLALVFTIANAMGYGETLNQYLQGLETEAPEGLQPAIEQIRQLVLRTDFGTLGAVGTVLVLWTGLGLFTRTEQAFNHIWRTSQRRRWARRVSDFIALVVLVPPLGLAALVLSSVLGGVRTIESLREQSSVLAWIYEAGLGFVPHLLLWVAFTALYRIMPSARVKWRAAAAGGVLAGSTMVFVHGFYIQAQVGVARANAIYATLAALPLLLIYLQILWTILLVGADVSYAVQNLYSLRGGEELPPPTPGVRRRLAWHLVQRASQAFRAGNRGVRISELAMELDVPGEWLDLASDDLLRMGVLVQVRGGDDLLMPARPPEKITPQQVLAAAEGEGGRFLDRVRLGEDQERALAEAERGTGKALAGFGF